MAKKPILLVCALMLPVLAAIAVARFALPEMLPSEKKNTTAMSLPKQKPRKLPETLEEARDRATKRLMHLQDISQAEWEEERQAILYRNPPQDLADVIKGTQQRLADLNRMTELEWLVEKGRMKALAEKEAETIAKLNPSQAAN